MLTVWCHIWKLHDYFKGTTASVEITNSLVLELPLVAKCCIYGEEILGWTLIHFEKYRLMGCESL
jgi:hypothetical protein